MLVIAVDVPGTPKIVSVDLDLASPPEYGVSHNSIGESFEVVGLSDTDKVVTWWVG